LQVREGELSYYKEEDLDNALNIIPLGPGLASVTKKGTDTFLVHTNLKTLSFRIPTSAGVTSEASVASERDEWVDAITQGGQKATEVSAGSGFQTGMPSLLVSQISKLTGLIREMVTHTQAVVKSVEGNDAGTAAIGEIQQSLIQFVGELSGMTVIDRPGGKVVENGLAKADQNLSNLANLFVIPEGHVLAQRVYAPPVEILLKREPEEKWGLSIDPKNIVVEATGASAKFGVKTEMRLLKVNDLSVVTDHENGVTGEVCEERIAAGLSGLEVKLTVQQLGRPDGGGVTAFAVEGEDLGGLVPVSAGAATMLDGVQLTPAEAAAARTLAASGGEATVGVKLNTAEVEAAKTLAAEKAAEVAEAGEKFQAANRKVAILNGMITVQTKVQALEAELVEAKEKFGSRTVALATLVSEHPDVDLEKHGAELEEQQTKLTKLKAALAKATDVQATADVAVAEAKQKVEDATAEDEAAALTKLEAVVTAAEFAAVDVTDQQKAVTDAVEALNAEGTQAIASLVKATDKMEDAREKVLSLEEQIKILKEQLSTISGVEEDTAEFEMAQEKLRTALSQLDQVKADCNDLEGYQKRAKYGARFRKKFTPSRMPSIVPTPLLCLKRACV
jgi:hypothetical protein